MSSFWILNSRFRNAPQFPKLIGNKDVVDVVIIGGGITGLSAALRLNQEGKKVAVIEASRVGSGVTGYSTAKLTSLHQICYADLLSKFGEEKTKMYAEMNQRGIDLIEENVKNYSIPCDFSRRSHISFLMADQNEESVIDKEVASCLKAGLKASKIFECDLPFAIKCGIKVEDQAQFNSFDYCVGLAKAFSENGGMIFEDSRVVSISHTRPYQVSTKEGSISGNFVIQACHIPITDRSGHFARVQPKSSYCLAYTLNDNNQMPHEMYITADHQPICSVRSADEGKVLIIAGAGHLLGKPEKTQEDCYQMLDEWARRNFPIKDQITRWSAHDYMSPDNVPYIGRLHKAASHLFCATGFKKWGLAFGSAASILFSDLINGKSNSWESLVDASRFDLVHGLGNLMKMNMEVGKNFVLDRIEDTHVPEISTLQKGCGGIFKCKGTVVAAYLDENGKMSMVSPNCSHLGCHIRFNNGDKTFDCPCHGSRFDVEGKVIHGPATEDLKKINLEWKKKN